MISVGRKTSSSSKKTTATKHSSSDDTATSQRHASILSCWKHLLPRTRVLDSTLANQTTSPISLPSTPPSLSQTPSKHAVVGPEATSSSEPGRSTATMALEHLLHDANAITETIFPSCGNKECETAHGCCRHRLPDDLKTCMTRHWHSLQDLLNDPGFERGSLLQNDTIITHVLNAEALNKDRSFKDTSELKEYHKQAKQLVGLYRCQIAFRHGGYASEPCRMCSEPISSPCKTCRSKSDDAASSAARAAAADSTSVLADTPTARAAEDRKQCTSRAAACGHWFHVHCLPVPRSWTGEPDYDVCPLDTTPLVVMPAVSVNGNPCTFETAVYAVTWWKCNLATVKKRPVYHASMQRMPCRPDFTFPLIVTPLQIASNPATGDRFTWQDVKKHHNSVLRFMREPSGKHVPYLQYIVPPKYYALRFMKENEHNWTEEQRAWYGRALQTHNEACEWTHQAWAIPAAHIQHLVPSPEDSTAWHDKADGIVRPFLKAVEAAEDKAKKSRLAGDVDRVSDEILLLEADNIRLRHAYNLHAAESFKRHKDDDEKKKNHMGRAEHFLSMAASTCRFPDEPACQPTLPKCKVDGCNHKCERKCCDHRVFAARHWHSRKEIDRDPGFNFGSLLLPGRLINTCGVILDSQHDLDKCHSSPKSSMSKAYVCRVIFDPADAICDTCKQPMRQPCDECQKAYGSNAVVSPRAGRIYKAGARPDGSPEQHVCEVRGGTCGHTYHLHCLHKAMTTLGRCPLDGTPWTECPLPPALDLDSKHAYQQSLALFFLYRWKCVVEADQSYVWHVTACEITGRLLFDMLDIDTGRVLDNKVLNEWIHIKAWNNLWSSVHGDTNGPLTHGALCVPPEYFRHRSMREREATLSDVERKTYEDYNKDRRKFLCDPVCAIPYFSMIAQSSGLTPPDGMEEPVVDRNGDVTFTYTKGKEVHDVSMTFKGYDTDEAKKLMNMTRRVLKGEPIGHDDDEDKNDDGQRNEGDDGHDHDETEETDADEPEEEGDEGDEGDSREPQDQEDLEQIYSCGSPQYIARAFRIASQHIDRTMRLLQDIENSKTVCVSTPLSPVSASTPTATVTAVTTTAVAATDTTTSSSSSNSNSNSNSTTVSSVAPGVVLDDPSPTTRIECKSPLAAATTADWSTSTPPNTHVTLFAANLKRTLGALAALMIDLQTQSMAMIRSSNDDKTKSDKLAMKKTYRLRVLEHQLKITRAARNADVLAKQRAESHSKKMQDEMQTLQTKSDAAVSALKLKIKTLQNDLDAKSTELNEKNATKQGDRDLRLEMRKAQKVAKDEKEQLRREKEAVESERDEEKTKRSAIEAKARDLEAANAGLKQKMELMNADKTRMDEQLTVHQRTLRMLRNQVSEAKKTEDELKEARVQNAQLLEKLQKMTENEAKCKELVEVAQYKLAKAQYRIRSLEHTVNAAAVDEATIQKADVAKLTELEIYYASRLHMIRAAKATKKRMPAPACAPGGPTIV